MLEDENFQRLASHQGKRFEDAVETIFQIANCEVVARGTPDQESGEQIDHILRTPGGHLVWIESKGSWRGNRPGLRRSDTAKKAVATAWNLKSAHKFQTPPYVLVTSHLPDKRSYPGRLLSRALDEGLFRSIVTLDTLAAELGQIDRELSEPTAIIDTHREPEADEEDI